MSVGVSSNANNVLQAVNKLYHDANVTEKEKASKWLGEFQRSVFAWETADQLLQLKHDVESTYFAAQTMRTKILYSFQELPPESHESLKDSLLTHIEHLCNMSPILTTQLALAVCDLALQMQTWKLPAVTFMQKYGKEESSLPFLLEILTVLPEEVNARALRLGENRRNEIIDELENSAPMVIELLQACVGIVDGEKMLTKIFKCLASWFYMDVLPGNHVARSKLLDIPFKVLRDVNTSSNLYESACDCVCAAMYSIENIETHHDLTEILYQGTSSLRETYHNAVAHEDTDKCLNLSRVFSDLGSCLIEAIISSPGVGFGDLGTLDLVLLCNGHCQYEVAEITFNLWYQLSEKECMGDSNTFSSIFGPYVMRLINSLVRHCQMEPDNDKILDKNDDLHEFRKRVLSLVGEVVPIVGALACFTHLFTMLSNSEPSWDITEATLFVMFSITKVLNLRNEEVALKVLSAILSLPPDTHIAVYHTAVRLVGRLSDCIEIKPELLDPTLQFLTNTLQKPELASISAESLQFLCLGCKALMTQHHSALIQLLQVADELKVSSKASLGLLDGVVLVVTSLPPQHIKEAINQLCLVQASKLQEDLNQNNSGNSYREAIEGIDRLAEIFKNTEVRRIHGEVIGNSNNLSQPPLLDNNMCKDVTEQMWPVLKAVLEKYISNNQTVERWCRCLRFIIRCLGASIQSSLLPVIADTITTNYSTQPHSCFIYLGSVLVDEYGDDSSLILMLSPFARLALEILQRENGLKHNPDTVDDLFRLCSRFVERTPVQFLSHEACPTLLECAVAGLKLEHREAFGSIAKFLRTIIESKPAEGATSNDQLSMLDNVINTYGPRIVEESLLSCLFYIPAYLYLDIADLWWSFIKRNRESFSTWLSNALKNLPTEHTLASATPDQTIQFFNNISLTDEWSKLDHLLRDFCRLYR